MSRRLAVVAGPAKGMVFAFPAGKKLKIGRGQASDVRVDDPRISRVHCYVEASPTGITITDIDSTGGTYVSGKRIQSERIKSGVVFQIGETCIRVEDDDFGSNEPDAAKPARISAKSLEDLVGTTLGHFKLRRMVYKGASSVLFLADDRKETRPAAVKVMLPTIMSDEAERSRFVRAVRTMINVRHSNLVEVYGAGKQGPFCWCAMEYVDGISIKEVIELIGANGRLDWRDVYRVAVHITRALECAHRNKVIHRNVTPDNLLQRKNDKVVKLCDLMLAKALEGTQARQVTAPGQLVGNVSYMAPERIADTANLDWRSDQYGLGATLYALLTGQPPFNAASLPELVKQVRHSPAQFPTDAVEETHPEFIDAVLKMLEKQPEQRFSYPSELLRCLDEIGKSGNADADLLYNY